MSNTPKILALAGSLRSGSFNKKLARVAADELEDAGAEVTYIDLKDYPLPLYDGDIEKSEGLPENAKELQDLFYEHDGLLIASPEYNSSISGVLKNAIDWISRPREGFGYLHAFQDSYAGLVATSTGSKGGLRSIYSLREILQNIGVTVLPDVVAVPNAKSAFAEDGTLTDEKSLKLVRNLCEELVDTLRRLGREKRAAGR